MADKDIDSQLAALGATPIEDQLAALGASPAEEEAPIEFNTSLKPVDTNEYRGATEGKGTPLVDQALGLFGGAIDSVPVLGRQGLNYGRAAAEYVRQAVSPTEDANWDEALDLGKQQVKDTLEGGGGATDLGRVVGTVAGSIATGGYGATAATAKLGTSAAKLGGASLLGRLAGLGAAGRVAATAAGAGAALATEGAIEGTITGAAKEIDDTIDKGDWSKLGSKLYASVPTAALEGAKWNAIIGGSLQVGLKGVQKIANRNASKAAQVIDNASNLSVGNAAQPNLQTEHIYDAARPLRSTDIVDNASPDVIALRKQTTPEVAKLVQNEEAAEIVKLYNEGLQLEAGLDHALRLKTKGQYLKDMQGDWTGPNIDDMLAQAGLDDRTLRSIERSAQGEGGSMVANLRKKIARAKQDLPGIKEEVVRGPEQPSGGARELDLDGTAAAPEVKRSGRNPTIGEMAAAMDDIKRAAQKVAAKSRYKNPLIHEALLDPSEALRLNLENPEVWGAKFAEDQTVINKRWRDHINSSKQLDGALSTEGRVGADAVGGDNYDVLEIADESKVKGLLNKIGTGDGEDLEEAFRANLRAQELSFGERLRWGGLDEADNRIKVARYAEVAREIEDRLNKVGLANRYAVENASKTLESPIGAAARAAVPTEGIFGKPQQIYKAWSEAKASQNSAAAFGIKRAMVKAQERLNKATKIKVEVDKAAPTLERLIKGATPGLTMEKVRSELELLDKTEDPESPESQAFQARLQELESHAGQELATAYIERMQARDSFLREKAGPPPEPTPFGTPERDLDDETSASLARYIQAVDDPMGALERMAAGTATAEDIETMEGMYPDMLSEWREKALAEATKGKQKYTADEQEELAGRLGIDLNGDVGESLAYWQQVSMTGMDEKGNHSPTPTSMGRFKVDPDQVYSRGDRLAT